MNIRVLAMSPSSILLFFIGSLTRLGQTEEIAGDALELRTRHRHRDIVLGLGDAEMLLIDVHQLEFVLTHPVGGGGVEPESDDVGHVLGLDHQHLVSLRRPHDLGERAEVEAEGEVAVASEEGEGVDLEHHRDEGDVGVVHRLEGDAFIVAVEVAVLDEVLDGLDDLGVMLDAGSLSQRAMISKHTFLKRSACSSFASNTAMRVLKIRLCSANNDRRYQRMVGGFWYL